MISKKLSKNQTFNFFHMDDIEKWLAEWFTFQEGLVWFIFLVLITNYDQLWWSIS